MIEKFPRQPVLYEGFTHQDLIDFAKSRRLKLSKTAHNHLNEYLSKHAATVQTSDADGIAIQRGHSDSSSVVLNTGSEVLLRRSSRLAALAGAATSTTLNKSVPLRVPKRTPMPARSPTAKRVVYESPRVAQEMLKRSLKAAEELSRKFLIQELEEADRKIQFDFFGLAAEVRDMILRYACISSATIVHPRQQPAIARTCSFLRNEALALYYGSNRFSVFVGRVKPGADNKTLVHMNSWLHELEPCYLACVRSLSFVHLGASLFLDIDFDIRGQKFGIVRQSTHPPPADIRYLRGTVDFRTLANSPHDIASIMDRWNARKGFSCSSIREIAEMLIEIEPDVESLWVDDFDQ
ncbi:hypothetical protein QM012_000629 [Aureobasidium pullulans]|uniref:Uncharacterized protein n=1 Tax=Aureobasidium pullulans TaxID=5580 RepID=A0ABR0TX02_AURPU